MRFVSWNVNGLRACWVHGLANFMQYCKADIYAFQETKTSEDFYAVVPEGYYAYWSHYKRRGYSGTLCMTRRKPLKVRYDMDDPKFDVEGRIITMEFEEFFFVNCYVPNSKRAVSRFDYRSNWDLQLFQFLSRLQKKKPVIVCGDFNATLPDRESYKEEQPLAIGMETFVTLERENIQEIVGSGFVDSYRYVHPFEKGKYTWWSQKNLKRKKDQGVRLDYFFVSEQIKHKIKESTMLTDVLGSDHCPILLETSMPSDVSHETKDKLPPCPYTFAELIGKDNRFVCNLARRFDLGNLWESLDWELLEKNLANLQMALAKVAYTKDMNKITHWQMKIVCSIDAKLLAVRHICSTQCSAGVDGITWETPHEKMAAALSLDSKGFRAMPTRLMAIRTKDGKQRRIHIETYYDRAMQCLYAYALDPVAESWGENKSFSFRKGRSDLDVNEYIKQGLSGEDAPEWVFVADIRKCYESISHDWIKENIPMSKYVLHQFLNAGYVFNGELFPMEKGVGIGCSLSPIVANMTLDGLQDYIYSKLYPHVLDIDYANGNMIRYADDIIFMCDTEETAKRIRQWTIEFLDERGLSLSPQKCYVVNIKDGFTFMGRTYYKSGTQVFCRPSDQSMERFMTNVRDTIEHYNGSQSRLIKTLNQKISGWASYHRISEAEGAYKEMDIYVTAMLLKLCEKMHPTWSREKIIEKYWFVDAKGRHCFALTDHKEVRVKWMEDTLLVNYDAMRTDMNPYIHWEYFERRRREREQFNITGVYRSIWERQEGRCYYCGYPILRDDEKALVEVNPERNSYEARMAYVHNRCRYDSLEYVDATVMPASVSEVMELLQELLEEKEKPLDKRRFDLSEHFRTCKKTQLTMTFDKMETILGKSLGVSALRPEFWYRTGFGCLSQCWIEHGYRIKELRLEERKVVFYRALHQYRSDSLLKIPKPLTGVLPANAINELKNFFKYITEKYAL